ncbi:phosphatidate cytidylyltransferase [Shimia haliotis]|uniref:Phosphatidate cytidylyltransferase n=1 Tax=Shimia haliotis TaxID=1280847 RepID=A0A1I4ED75_9RHOB|nr:phosphatidate cytidylyltransferase [Shimia haliotis]SFL02121.1 phosphatidate cytidylyltransferase [Shimia haliotis]
MTPLLVKDMALIAGALLIAGYALLSTVALLPKTRALGLDLLRTFFSATLIVCVLTGLFLLGPLALVPAFALAALRIGFESASVRMKDGPAPLLIGILTAGLTVVATLDDRIAMAVLGVWALLLVRLIVLPNASNPRTSKSILDLMVFPVLPLALLAYGAIQPNLAGLMFAAYLLVEIFDSLALLCGKLFGRTKAFPTLSPNKTIGGLVGGALSLIVLTAFGAYLLDQPLGLAALLAVFVGCLAVAGDLAASRLKRIGGVKDFPIVFSRQGGLLDSLDSWIAAGAGLIALSLLASLC